MLKKSFNLLMLATFAAGLFVFTGCEDKDYFDPDFRPKSEGTASNLDFSTTQKVQLDLNYDVTKGFVSTFDVYAENPFKDGVLRTDISPIAGGINVAGVSKLTKVIPAHVKDLYVYSEDLFIPKLMHATIANGVASFEPAEYLSATEVTSRTIGSADNLSIDHFLTTSADYYTSVTTDRRGNVIAPYKYDLKDPIKTVTFPAEVMTSINQTFPDDKAYEKLTVKHPGDDYFQDAIVRILSGSDEFQGANIYVSLALASGMYRNSLSYFVYTSETKDITELTEAERNKLKIVNIFQLADAHDNAWKLSSTSSYKYQGLTAGKAVKLEYVDNDGNIGGTFPIGAQVGFVLHSDGFKDSFTSVSGTRIYSIADWNPGKAKHTVFFGAKDKDGKPYNFFGFEDMIGATTRDCNDLIFNVLTDPIDAIKPPKFIPVPGTQEKESTHCGILAFEDNWPMKGDYDLNDVVVKYKSTVTEVWKVVQEVKDGPWVPTEDPTTIKEVADEFTFIHYGATFNNGFSYKVDIAPSSVKSIKVDGVAYTPVADGNGFIVKICDNVKDHIAPMTYGVTSKTFKVEIAFVDGTVMKDGFADFQAPYNPYITPTNTNPELKSVTGIEVHLPFYAPTTKADMSLFGHYEDVSDILTGTYYACKENAYFPFALHLSGCEEFKITQEGLSIDNSYGQYMNWVNSRCANYADWYNYPANY